MKKIFGFATTVLLTVALAACGTGSNNSADSTSASGENTKLVVGASVTPHAEILEQAKPLLEKKEDWKNTRLNFNYGIVTRIPSSS